jgi:signal transduction histidine kinase
VRHANPSTIEVATAVEQATLAVVVRDDGCGFAKPRRRGRGRGLGNMERRAEEIGATLCVASDASGTRVELRLPL